MPTSSAESACRPPHLLEVDSVVAGYGGSRVLSGVSLVVGSGEVVSVVGPNGAGKSTLLKTVIGAIRCESGAIHLEGKEITNMPPSQLARLGVGYVPQSREVFAELTVRENLEMGGYLLNRRDVSRAVEEMVALLPSLGRMMKRRAEKLSGGERKVVAIGRALMNRPRVLLLDEPTAGLSAELSTDVLKNEVAGLAQTGAGVLLVEQKAIAALEVSHWSYVLAAGRTLLACSASELLARPDLSDVFLGARGAAKEQLS